MVIRRDEAVAEQSVLAKANEKDRGESSYRGERAESSDDRSNDSSDDSDSSDEEETDSEE